jgi:hypothetical protein
MGFRFQRRIRIAPGVRLRVSKSGIGGSVRRNGLRLGLDARLKKYFSVALPGTGLSYRTLLGRPVIPQTLRKVDYTLIAALCVGALVVL